MLFIFTLTGNVNRIQITDFGGYARQPGQKQQQQQPRGRVQETLRRRFRKKQTKTKFSQLARANVSLS